MTWKKALRYLERDYSNQKEEEEEMQLHLEKEEEEEEEDKKNKTRNNNQSTLFKDTSGLTFISTLFNK